MALDKTRLEAIMAMRSQQEVKKSYGSTDPNFPLFKTPVGENLLVYIPTLNVTELPDGGEVNNLLETVVHDYHNGKQFGTIPCISGIPEDNPLAIELGYAGHSCPACEANAECWSLVDAKISAVAKELGIDPNNDPSGTIKQQRSSITAEMAIKGSQTYVTFPIVVIPHKKMMPTADAKDNLKVYFVTMVKKRYEEKVCAGLDSLIASNGHIAGRFMLWKFIYDTEGKQPNSRDAARNASFQIITDGQALSYYNPLKDACEEAAKEFTNLKALEVLPALACKSYDEIVKDVTRVMHQTRLTLAAIGNGDTASNALPSSSPENVLKSFGATPTNLGVDESETATQSETPVNRFG